MMNALYITPRLYPDNNGGTLHNHGLCAYLSRTLDLTAYAYLDEKYSMDAAAADASGRPYTVRHYYRKKANPISGVRGKLAFMEPADETMLADVQKQISGEGVGIVFYTLKMSLLVERIRKRYPTVRYVYISHNSEYLNIRADLEQYDRHHEVGKLHHILKLLRIGLFTGWEKRAVRSSDKVFSISEQDSDNLSNHFGVRRDKFVLSRPMIRYQSARPEDKWSEEKYTHSLMIVGNMNWYPTVEGVLWVIRNVLPALTAKDSGIKLYVVGANPSQEIRDAAEGNDHIVVTGFVDSIEEYYCRCDIALIPIFSGTGAKIKVLEAVGQNIPAVISGFAAKDYAGIEGAAFIADTAEEFAEKTLSLMADADLRKEISGKEKVYYSHYMESNPAVDEAVNDLLQQSGR